MRLPRMNPFLRAFILSPSHRAFPTHSPHVEVGSGEHGVEFPVVKKRRRDAADSLCHHFPLPPPSLPRLPPRLPSSSLFAPYPFFRVHQQFALPPTSLLPSSRLVLDRPSKACLVQDPMAARATANHVISPNIVRLPAAPTPAAFSDVTCCWKLSLP